VLRIFIRNGIDQQHMAKKRLTDTGKWNKKWWRSLPAAYKLFWMYVCDVCDHAGVWEVDMEAAMLYVGEVLDEHRALELFDTRVQKVDNGKHWWLTGFVHFQYGDMKDNNKMYKPVVKVLEKYGLNVNNHGASMGDVSGIDGGIIKVIVKDKVTKDNTLIDNNTINIKSDKGASMGVASPIDGALNVRNGREVLKLADCLNAFLVSDVCGVVRDLIMRKLYEQNEVLKKVPIEQRNGAAMGVLKEWGERFNETLAGRLMTARGLDEWTSHLQNWINKQDLSVNPKFISNGNNGSKRSSGGSRPSQAGILQPGDSFQP
jgi:hypothetical protein